MIRSRDTNAIQVNYDPDRRVFLPPSDDDGPFPWWAFYRQAVDDGAQVQLVPDAPIGGGYSVYHVASPIGGGWDDRYFLVHHATGEEPGQVDDTVDRIRMKRSLQGPQTRDCECEHIDHFEGDGHAYGLRCTDVVELRTVAGTFHVCLDCRDNHLAPFLAEAAG